MPCSSLGHRYLCRSRAPSQHDEDIDEKIPGNMTRVYMVGEAFHEGKVFGKFKISAPLKTIDYVL